MLMGYAFPGVLRYLGGPVIGAFAILIFIVLAFAEYLIPRAEPQRVASTPTQRLLRCRHGRAPPAAE